jgi:hypothetical protein
MKILIGLISFLGLSVSAAWGQYYRGSDYEYPPPVYGSPYPGLPPVAPLPPAPTYPQPTFPVVQPMTWPANNPVQPVYPVYGPYNNP